MECEPHLHFEALDLRPAHEPALHAKGMEQLRHRLTNVSPKGQRRSVDQNTLKRAELDDLESPAVATHPLRPGFLIQSDELPRGLPQPRDQGEP